MKTKMLLVVAAIVVAGFASCALTPEQKVDRMLDQMESLLEKDQSASRDAKIAKLALELEEYVEEVGEENLSSELEERALELGSKMGNIDF